MVNINEVKKDVLKSINYARDRAQDFLEKDIDCNDLTQLTSVIIATEDARSMTHILTKLFPGDASIEYLRDYANNVYDTGYQGVKRFETQCKCVNRKK